MNNITNEKCSFLEHGNIDAIGYCNECDIYICEKCKDYHNNLIEIYHNKTNTILMNKENNEEDIEICYEQNHHEKLEYFCKTHNKLCCRACVTKIKGLGNGQHSQCDICFIKDIINERKILLKNNVIYLQNNFSSFDDLYNKLKSSYEEISEKKEKLKIKIQKLFTKIRNDINKREDQLLLKVEQIYDNHFFDKNIIKELNKIKNQINISFNKGKLALNKFDTNNTNIISLINDCILIEESIKNINKIKEHYLKYSKNKKIIIDLKLKEEEIKFITNIKTLGEIYSNNYFYKIKNNFDELNFSNRKYIIIDNKENVAKKIVEDNQFTLIKCENNFELNKIYKWKINILNSKLKVIMVGITQEENNSNISLNNINGWYFYCFNSTLYSGKPHNYKNKKLNIDKVNKYITIIFNTIKGNLDFILDDNNHKIEGYNNIPLDKKIFPAILLYDKYDTVEINEY